MGTMARMGTPFDALNYGELDEQHWEGVRGVGLDREKRALSARLISTASAANLLLVFR